MMKTSNLGSLSLKTQSITHWLKKLRPPLLCALCTHHHQGQHAICEACLAYFTPILSACTLCALPLPHGQFKVCGNCLKNKPHFDKVIAPYSFVEPLRTILHELKYHQGLYLTPFLAQLILNHLPPDHQKTDCLIPVPMHQKRLSQRGFNQAGELTKTLSKILNIPHDFNVCQKIVPTPPQAGLSAKARQKNLARAFKVTPSSYQHVTLIDDLLTTGSTANELAKLLKLQGVKHVSVWCCARVAEQASNTSYTQNA
jgi:ComF family protein